MFHESLLEKVRSVLGHETIHMDVTALANALEGDSNGEHTRRRIQEEIDRLTSMAAQDAVGLLDRRLKQASKEQRKFTSGFEKRLAAHWGTALDSFGVFRVLSLEFGADCNERYRPKAAENEDYVFDCLTRLHGRGCLTASEIGALLRSGHATGANARWRTLHELAIVAMFIAQHGQEVGRRYLAHDAVQRFKAAGKYQEACASLGEKPLSEEEIAHLRRDDEVVVREFGPKFRGEYGWASEVLGQRTTFAGIARSINLGHWAPYVRMASEAIHAGPRAAFFDLGLPDGAEMILSGPSHYGLADPGVNSLVSLLQVTVPLLTHPLTGLESGGRELDTAELVDHLMLIAEVKILQGLKDIGVASFMDGHAEEEQYEPQAGEPPRLWERRTPDRNP